MASSVTLRVYRWTPGQPERSQEYRVAAAADTTVLDALVDVQRGQDPTLALPYAGRGGVGGVALVDGQRGQDPTLAFRYACRVGMCGSCAMVVNGRERWACRTRLESL